jgi:predicted HTH transcriptional regulator
LGEWITGSAWGKQLGRDMALDFVEGSQKEQLEKLEKETDQKIRNLILEIKRFLADVSVLRKTKLEKNSDAIVQRLENVGTRRTCKGRMSRLTEILASLQAKTLVFNTELTKMVRNKKQRTAPGSRFSPPADAAMPTRKSLEELLADGESKTIEFKSTLRWDLQRKDVNKNLEYACIRTLAGFMNAQGGSLVIGIADDGSVRGLTDDYMTLVKKNRDGFELHLRQLVESAIGKLQESLIEVRFEKDDAKEICIICVGASKEPVFLSNRKGIKEFPVRFGNSTKALDIEETTRYIRVHW